MKTFLKVLIAVVLVMVLSGLVSAGNSVDFKSPDQVKIFYVYDNMGCSIYGKEKEINTWLSDNKGKITIVQIDIVKSAQGGSCIVYHYVMGTK